MSRRNVLLGAAGLVIAVGLSAVSTHLTQQQVRAAQRQAVRGCDAAWSLCRFKATGQSPADAHGCVWIENPAPGNDPIFTNPAAGYATACSYAPAPTDEPTEDEGACGASWRVCYDLATADAGAGR